MTRAVYDVRVYGGRCGGFAVVAKMRYGFHPLGEHPTLAAAVDAGRAVEGRIADQPIYVFDYSLSDQRAGQVVAGLEALAGAK